MDGLHSTITNIRGYYYFWHNSAFPSIIDPPYFHWSSRVSDLISSGRTSWRCPVDSYGGGGGGHNREASGAELDIK